ncbi:alpha/beta hydrolase [Mycolicibacterium aromaticivorans JS19b1 = JCM 16368]|uniref:Alpha/beta hydrolase n=2 Tax=Mycolicibacterium aromaticivorans TaxID=318425 RepID=A0A064CI39_9MYCO|nr:alpha/beta hydrolase [Mycolicibacterium aromaticivorans JS19b1 = JCM 16368]
MHIDADEYRLLSDPHPKEATDMPTPGVVREFIGMSSPTARRAGAGGHPCQGLYHRGVGRKPKVAVIATHYQIDFSEHYLADYLATRGVGFLGWNTRFRGFESSFMLDHALVDIGVGVRWLRDIQGVETVVLLGNSGGGSLMAAYQSQAVDPNVTPLEGMRPAAGLTELPAADGYIASAAHPGRPDVLTAWMDGAVTDENDAVATDPGLDLFDEGNGPPFSDDFLARYRAAQVARNHAITDWAETELKRVQAAGFTDRPFTVMRTWADPRMVDPAIEPTKRQPNLCYAGVPVKANRSAHGIAAACTLRSWLGMWSLKTAQTRAEPHLGRVTVPALVINAEQDTGVFPSDAQRIFDALASTDKTLCAIDTDHYFTTPGARGEQADTIAKWIAKRWR